MADEKGSKSKVVPGGTKAADFAKDKDTATPPTPPGNAANANTPAAGEGLAPVTTAAGMTTPVPPSEKNPPVGAVGGLPNPGVDEIDLDAPAPPLPPMRGGKRLKPLDDDEFDDDEPATAALPSPITVHDFVGNIKEFVAAIRDRDFPKAFRTAAFIISVYADLMDAESFGTFAFAKIPGTMVAPLDIDRVGLALASCRNDLSAALAGPGPKWTGGDPHPLSGSPMPMGVPAGGGAAAIDPQLFLVIFEVVSKLWEAFRKKRG